MTSGRSYAGKHGTNGPREGAPDMAVQVGKVVYPKAVLSLTTQLFPTPAHRRHTDCDRLPPEPWVESGQEGGMVLPLTESARTCDGGSKDGMAGTRSNGFDDRSPGVRAPACRRA